MKSLALSVLISVMTLLHSATAQLNANAQGCVIYKPASSGVPLVEEFLSITDFGTNISLKTLSGENMRIFHGQDPIVVPYPSNKTATKATAYAALARARTILPKSTRRWDSIATAWAALPNNAKPLTPKPPLEAEMDLQKRKGESLTTKDGAVYHNILVTSTTPAYITVQHENGVTRIMLETLAGELQKQYGYDPAKAADYLRSEALAEAERAREKRITEKIADFDKLSIYVKGEVDQVINEQGGISFTGTAYRVNPARSSNGTTSLKKEYVGSTGKIFILGQFKGMIDGGEWEGQIWPAGTFTYESVGAGTKTISRWSVNRLQSISELTK